MTIFSCLPSYISSCLMYKIRTQARSVCSLQHSSWFHFLPASFPGSWAGSRLNLNPHLFLIVFLAPTTMSSTYRCLAYSRYPINLSSEQKEYFQSTWNMEQFLHTVGALIHISVLKHYQPIFVTKITLLSLAAFSGFLGEE